MPHRLQIPMQSPTVPDEESCEIPFLPCRFMPRRLQIPVQSSTVSRSDPHSDPVNGSTNPDAVKQNLIPDVVPQLEKTVILVSRDLSGGAVWIEMQTCIWLSCATVSHCLLLQ